MDPVDIYRMKLHETTSIEGWVITRVHNGWIYSQTIGDSKFDRAHQAFTDNAVGGIAVFVPLIVDNRLNTI
jgi:hypothetical protein